jgi:hypothetical protein
MTRLVQLQSGDARCVALVDEPHLRPLAGAESVYALALEAIALGLPLTTLAGQRMTEHLLDYDDIYDGNSKWRLRLPIEHPLDPSRCLVSGTGLTHLGSAAHRQAMHSKTDAELTDSMKMFRLGVEAGRPDAGTIGAAPEWFYKGNGAILRGHLDPLEVPEYALDGGEEAEIAGVYVNDPVGAPWRIGMTIGNEFSDHQFERLNYLNLAGSKIRTCAIGPELVINPRFDRIGGVVSIERNGSTRWTSDIATGASEMCHSLENLEHHHFKFEAHRRPGDLHVHYYGAHSLSVGDGIELADGDVTVVAFEGFGRALRNPVRVAPASNVPVVVRPLA